MAVAEADAVQLRARVEVRAAGGVVEPDALAAGEDDLGALAEREVRVHEVRAVARRRSASDGSTMRGLAQRAPGRHGAGRDQPVEQLEHGLCERRSLTCAASGR